MQLEKINQWFYRRGQWIINHRLLTLSMLLVALLIGGFGLTKLNIKSTWEDYFLEDDPMILQTDKFKDIFGNDSFVAVLVQSDDIFTAENLGLIREMSNELLDSVSFSDKVTSLTDMEFLSGEDEGMTIEQLVPEDIPTDAESLAEIKAKVFSKKSLANRLVSKDGRSAWILLKLRPFPDPKEWDKDNKELTKGAKSADYLTGAEARAIILKEKYAKLHPLATGMPYLASEKMDWVEAEMPRVMGLAVLIALLVLAIATRSLRGVLIPIVTAICSVVMAYGVVGYIGLNVDSGMLLIPMLLAFAVSVAYNIHIFSYFERRLREHGKRKQASVETIGSMAWAVLFSAFTTFAALLSFLAIPVVPMHFVGISASTSVIFAFMIALTLTPIALSLGKDVKPKHNDEGEVKQSWLDTQLEKLGDWVLNHEKLIWTVFLSLSLVLLYFFTKVEAAFDVERTQGRKVEYVDNLLKVCENDLGSLYSYDMMIEFPEDGMAKQVGALESLDKLNDFVLKEPLVKRTNSLLTILKDLNQTLNSGEDKAYCIPNNDNEIAQELLLYENAGGSESEYWIDYDYKRLRLKIELSNYNSEEVERELKEITDKAKELFPNALVTPVGVVPQFTAMMQYVVRGQMMSFLISLLIIGVLMSLVFGSIKIGLVGLIPNVMPAIVVGGLMGLMNYPLDMMTATIMPMILGLAVDDTIHFINHGQLEFERETNYRSSVLKTFRIVGTPIILTSIIMSANFATYTISDSRAFVNMGLLSVAGMMTALLSDLFITPLLFRRFNIFGKEKK